MAGARHILVAPCVVQPVAQQARTHRRAAAVEQRKQRGRLLAADRLGQFEVAPGGGIQADEFIFRFQRQAVHVLQAAPLRRLGIAQQRTGRAKRRAQAIGAKAGEGGHGQLVEQRLVPAHDIEVPVRHALRVHAGAVVEQVAGGVAAQDLGRRNALEFLLQAHAHRARIAGKLHQFQRARRQRQPCQARGDNLALADHVHRQQRALGFFRQQVGIGQRPGRHHAHDLAFDRPLAGGRIADLLADGARLAQLHQLGEIRIERMERNAAHPDRVAILRAPRRERDAEDPRRFFRIVVKQFVEVTHAVEH
jgi:hypothetical protein